VNHFTLRAMWPHYRKNFHKMISSNVSRHGSKGIFVWARKEVDDNHTVFLITKSVHHLIVRLHIYSSQTVDIILETVMCCDKLLATLPNVRWAEPVFGITSQLLESSIKFIANNFCSVLSSDRYIYWIWFKVKVMLWNWMDVNCKLKTCLEHCVCICMVH
jgi:hypothetical protein